MSDDADSTTRSFSVPRGQSLALHPGNALVTRGLQDIAQFGNGARAKELVNLGNACYDKRDYDQAIAYYTETIRLNPGYAEAYFYRGMAYAKNGNLAHDNEDSAAAFTQFDNAIADVTEILRLKPGYFDATAYCIRAAIYDMKGAIALDNCDCAAAVDQLDNAIADYAAAMRLDSGYAGACAGAYTSRGDAHHAIGDYDNSIADYTEAIRLDPKDAAAYHNRGCAYLKKADRAKAESDFAEAKRLGYNLRNGHRHARRRIESGSKRHHGQHSTAALPRMAIDGQLKHASLGMLRRRSSET